ncbi:hypothetical protein [Paraflavisolibacter sp. H34]|uniref:hypothetical protein n=1 Tax=Huijunlia imazamoxiresistens TaxID=3127457 RepID=UPI00301B6A57
MSVRDLQEDLDIRHQKWDFLFDFMTNKTTDYYFLGHRLNFKDKDFESTIDFLTGKVLDNANYHEVLLKLKPTAFMFNRRLVSELWWYYEYPALIFLTSDENENELTKLYYRKIEFEELAVTLENAYIIHRSFQPDVLWIKQAYGLPPVENLF